MNIPLGNPQQSEPSWTEQVKEKIRDKRTLSEGSNPI